MKIAIIANKLNLKTGGGSNNQLHIVASELVNLGQDVSVITLNRRLTSCPDDLPYRVVRENLISNRIDRSYVIGLLRVLHKYENQVDIYHLWTPTILLGGSLYRWWGGKVPVVANLIGFIFCQDISRMDLDCCRHCGLVQRIMHRTGNPLKKALRPPLNALESTLAMRVANHVDAFLPDTITKAQVYSWLHFDVDKMTVIPVPKHYEYLRGLKETHSPGPFVNDAYNILYAGRLSSEKGVDILIKATAKLDFPVRLHIVGDGPLRNELELLAKGLGISDRVIFHGWVAYEKLAEFYLSSQLFVHPARFPEFLCNTVVEAMTLGMPVVVADYGDVASQSGGAALPFKPADADDLTEKIKLVHDTPSLAASLAEKAQEKAKEFDYKRVIPKYIEVYRAIIGSEM